MGDDISELLEGWDYTTLPPNIRVGRDCFLEARRLFDLFASEQDPGLVIGDRVRVYLGGWGGGFGILASGRMEIGEDSVLTGAQIMCVEQIVIGRRVLGPYNVVIADGDFHPRDPDLRRRDAVLCSVLGPDEERDPFSTAPVVIGDDARIGINAIILKGVTIGAGASVHVARW